MTIIISSMRKVFLPRHFLASGLLLLILASLYVFFEAQRLQQELLRQTEDKGTALAKAIGGDVNALGSKYFAPNCLSEKGRGNNFSMRRAPLLIKGKKRTAEIIFRILRITLYI